MKTLLLTGIALLASVPAYASNYWEAFSTKSADAVPICGMETKMRDGGAFMIKAQGDTDGLWVQFFKMSWKFPADGSLVEVPLTFTLDSGDNFDATATGYMGVDGNGKRTIPAVEFKIMGSFKTEFLESIAHADGVRVVFKNGSERPWTMNMTGSRRAVTELKQCAASLPIATPTQPYSTTSSTKKDNGSI